MTPRLKTRATKTNPSKNFRLRRMPQINILRRANSAAEFNFVSDLLQHDLKRPEHGQQIEKIVIPQMRDAEHVPLHRALSVGEDGAKSRAHFLDDFGGLNARRSIDRGHRVRR